MICFFRLSRIILDEAALSPIKKRDVSQLQITGMLNCTNLTISVMLYEVSMLLIPGAPAIDIDFSSFPVCLASAANTALNSCNVKLLMSSDIS